ncbi:MAG TPA: UDP-N-acetylmuramoyl-tripeptide--D-alanyl-D-alanine ligase, partial [Gammaproteobacteria bacterium]
VERPLPLAIPQLVVDDSRLALGRLAAAWRRELQTVLVGVTGSNGKTTVKEMCAAILSRAGTTLSTRGNLNNDIGLPLTLLRLSPDHRYGVIEMGANHPGEIAYLTKLAAPQVAIITNAAPAHLEGFGDVEGVARAKGEIFAGLSEEGVAVLNADDDFAALWQQLSGSHRTLRFGLTRSADVGARGLGDVHGSELEVLTPLGGFHLDLPLPGRHNIMNALAAVCAALALNIEFEDIVAGLESLAAVKGRLTTRTGRNGATILDDSYNANPASLHAGLQVLAGCGGRRLLALGDMGELGENAEALHRQAGRQARELDIDGLYATGNLSRHASEAYGEGGHFYEQQQQLIEALLPQMSKEVTVLVKGSRSSRMERVVEALCAEGEV